MYFFNANINQMKQAIHIRCTQQFLYFESHKKSLKQLMFVSVYFLSVPHLQYQHILVTRVPRNRKRMISGTCTNIMGKKKVKRKTEGSLHLGVFGD
jgi:hypothetical protein